MGAGTVSLRQEWVPEGEEGDSSRIWGSEGYGKQKNWQNSFRFAFLKDHTGCSLGNGLEKEAGRPFRSLYQYSRLETMTPHLLYSKCPEPAASATRRSFPETQTPVSTPPGPLNQILHYNYISKSGYSHGQIWVIKGDNTRCILSLRM